MLPNAELRKSMGKCVGAGVDAGPGSFGAIGEICKEISKEQDFDVIFFRDLSHTFHNLGKNSVLNCPQLYLIWGHIKKMCAHLTNNYYKELLAAIEDYINAHGGYKIRQFGETRFMCC